MIRHQDIALTAGVSRTTVSKALNGLPGIDPEEAKRIRALAESMGYRRNRLARSVKTGRTHIIGCLVNDISNPYYAEVMSGIEDIVVKNDYVTIFLDWSRSAGHSIERLLEYKVDGLILTTAPDTANLPILDDLADSGVRVVLGYEGPADHGYSRIICDYKRAAFELTNHLIGLGHESIAFAYSYNRSTRGEGYSAAMMAGDLTPMYITDLEYTDTLNGGLAAGAHIASIDNPPTAVIAYNDIMALGIISSLRSRGVRVPEDLSIAGFDGARDLAHSICLTTMRTDNIEMGIRMAEEVLRLIKGGEPQDIRIPHKLSEGITVQNGKGSSL